MSSAPSAPASLAKRVRSMASRVLFEPAPASTGMRPLTCSTQMRMTSRCSSWLRVADSPVVPQGTRPLMPCSICHSMSSRNRSSSTRPLRNGVTMAVKAQVNCMVTPCCLRRGCRSPSMFRRLGQRQPQPFRVHLAREHPDRLAGEENGTIFDVDAKHFAS